MIDFLYALLPPPQTSWDLMAREVGRSVAHATLSAGPPDGFSNLPDGDRAYHWQMPALIPRGGPQCTFTLYASNDGQRNILAGWKVIAIEPPAPECR